MNQCGVVDCLDAHVIETYKVLINNCLVWSDIKIDLHPIFLIFSLNVKLNDEVWYLKNLVGKNMFSTITKMLTFNIDFKGKRITNNSIYGVGITRLEKALVPLWTMV